jgi:hypothetical protein
VLCFFAKLSGGATNFCVGLTNGNNWTGPFTEFSASNSTINSTTYTQCFLNFDSTNPLNNQSNNALNVNAGYFGAGTNAVAQLQTNGVVYTYGWRILRRQPLALAGGLSVGKASVTPAQDGLYVSGRLTAPTYQLLMYSGAPYPYNNAGSTGTTGNVYYDFTRTTLLSQSQWTTPYSSVGVLNVPCAGLYAIQVTLGMTDTGSNVVTGEAFISKATSLAAALLDASDRSTLAVQPFYWNNSGNFWPETSLTCYAYLLSSDKIIIASNFLAGTFVSGNTRSKLQVMLMQRVA